MTYCISDIHGEYELFLELMNKIAFTKSDTLIVLGDLIDKGMDSVRLLKVLLAHPNCKVILGNHEYDFLKFYWGAMRQAGDNYEKVLDKLQNYFPHDKRRLTWEIMDMLEGLPAYFEFDNFICAHSGVPLDVNDKVTDLSKATIEQLVYDRGFKDRRVIPQESKCVIYGHTPTRYLTNRDEIIFYSRSGNLTGKISDYYKIHIDTGVYLSGVLGCLRIDDCKTFYVKK